MHNLRKFATLFLVLILAGCQSKGHKQPAAGNSALQPESAHTAAPQPAAAPNSASSSDMLKFAAPSGWVSETPSSSSRWAQYKLPRAAGDAEDAEMVVFYFQGGGGTPEANIERWIGQFQNGKSDGSNARVEHKKIHGMAVTTLDVKGAYDNSTMMSMQGKASGPKEHFRMLAAVVETASGPWFFKLTGPENTVARWQPSFEQFLDSIEQK